VMSFHLILLLWILPQLRWRFMHKGIAHRTA
jgi:hypothetical protein